MTYTFSVAYPAGTTFDLNYYLTSHMPLVQKLWAPHGLKSWRVAQYTNADSPYVVQAWLEWESKEAYEKGQASLEGADVFKDVPKFSDKTPVLLHGELVGSASW